MIVASGRLSGVLSFAITGTLPARLCTHAADSSTYVEVDTARRLVVSIAGTATTGDSPLWRSGESGSIDVSLEAGGGSVATRARVRTGGDDDTTFDPFALHSVTHGTVPAGSITLGSGVTSTDTIPAWSTAVLASVEYRTLDAGAFAKTSTGYTYANATAGRYMQVSASALVAGIAANAERIGSYDGAVFGRLHAKGWTNVIPHADDFSVSDGTYGWWLEGESSTLGLPGPAGISNAARFHNENSGFGLNTYVVIPTAGQACTISQWVQQGPGNGRYAVELEGSTALSMNGTAAASWSCRSTVGAATSGWIEWNCYYYGITVPVGPYDSIIDYPQIETGAVEHPFAATSVAADNWTVPAASVVSSGRVSFWLRSIPLWSLASGGASEATGTSTLFAAGDVTVTLNHSTRTITVTVGGASQASSAITIGSRRTRYDVFVKAGNGAPEVRVRPVGGSASTILTGGAVQASIASTGTHSVLTDTGATGQWEAIVEHVRWYASGSAPSWASDAPSGTTGTAVASLPTLDAVSSGTSVVTGSGAGDLPTLSGVSAGTSVVTGSGTASLPTLDVVASGGASAVTGTATADLPVLDAVAVGVPVVSGAGVGDLPTLDVVSAGGITPVTGTGVASLPTLDAAAVGTTVVAGTAAADLPTLDVSAAGSLVAVTGSGAADLPALDALASGTTVVTGSGVASLPTLDTVGADAGFVGTATADLPTLDVTAAGTVLVTGSAVSDLPTLDIAAAGAPVVAGSTVADLPTLDAVVVALVPVTGAVVAALPTLDAIGADAGFVGSAVADLPSLDVTAVGSSSVVGSAVGVLPDLDAVVVAVAPVVGSGLVDLPTLDAVASGSPAVAGPVVADLPTLDVVAAGTAGLDTVGSATCALPTLDAVAVGTVLVTGSTVADLPTLDATGAGTVLLSGTVVAGLPSLDAVGAGSPVVTGSGAGALPTLDVAAGGGVTAVTGDAVADLPGLSVVSVGAPVVISSGSADLPDLSAVATGTPVVVASALADLPGLDVAASGAATVFGSVVADLPTLDGYSVARVSMLRFSVAHLSATQRLTVGHSSATMRYNTRLA